MVPLKYLSNLLRTLKMALINFEINHILTWSANCVVSNAALNQATAFAITDSKLHGPVVTLLTQDIAKLLQQLKSGFKRTINWHKYRSKVTIQAPNPYLDFLIDLSFQGVNRLFLSDCNWTRSHNHLVHKQTLNHLAKMLRGRNSLTFRQLKSVDSL